jgi:hypothetical protein
MSFPHQTTTPPVVHMKHAINLLSKKEFWQKPQNGHCCRAQPAPPSQAKPSQAKAAARPTVGQSNQEVKETSELQNQMC